jgi:YesN/AraC family two-component response regulator
VISAYSETDFLLAAIEMEVDGYILKPVDSERLSSVVARCADIVRLRKEVRQRDRDQRKLIDELQQALSEIRTLQGILPICSHCKKIRDDEGYWSQVETYISLHSDVLFSHGICPECLELHYPRYAPKKP